MTTEPEPEPERSRRHRARPNRPGQRPNGPEFWASIAAVVSQAPPMTEAQLDHVARLFRGGRPGSTPSPAPEP